MVLRVVMAVFSADNSNNGIFSLKNKIYKLLK